ncbi:MAG: hypothetical protein ACREHC_07925 [Candidatus Levyibacteriota bacterium]
MPDVFFQQSKDTPTQPTKGPGITASVHKIVVGAAPVRSLGLFSHYFPNPGGVSFVNQEADERIILFLRQHFITNTTWILATIGLLLFPFIIFAIFTLSNFALFTLPRNFIIILLTFYYLAVFNYALVNFIVWFYHVGIVTQKRLLDLDVYNILNHHLAETYVVEVVDVSYSQQGFAQSFFNYGDVHMQTKAALANFDYELAPKPATVSDIITDLRAETVRD